VVVLVNAEVVWVVVVVVRAGIVVVIVDRDVVASVADEVLSEVVVAEPSTSVTGTMLISQGLHVSSLG